MTKKDLLENIDDLDECIQDLAKLPDLDVVAAEADSALAKHDVQAYDAALEKMNLGSLRTSLGVVNAYARTLSTTKNREIRLLTGMCLALGVAMGEIVVDRYRKVKN
jgi:DNA-binding Xre family transcriptional regulator